MLCEAQRELLALRQLGEREVTGRDFATSARFYIAQNIGFPCHILHQVTNDMVELGGLYFVGVTE
jgi:hypothetical protein